VSHGGDQKRNKKGLRVGHSESVTKHVGNKKGRHLYEYQNPGWYVWTWACTNGGHGWRPILGLCFIRQRDAERARLALLAAGYDTFEKLRNANGYEVKAIACEYLQW
jgi:hypothetical protein